jgi:hypothetical protein
MIPDTITSNPAILASVLVRAELPELATAGAAAWRPLLQASLQLLALTDVNYIRIAVDTYTLIIQREGTSTIGVVIATGDPIGKSVHRIIRRAVGATKRSSKPSKAGSTHTDAGGRGQSGPVSDKGWLRAATERRVVENEGRDDDGDIVIRDGKPHPAHIPSQW